MCEMWNDGETCSVWDETWIKARKNHKCDSCSKRIRPSEKYVKHFSVFDGTVTTEKCCASCKASRDEFGKEEGHYLPTPSSFTEALGECIADDDSTHEERKKWRAVLRNIERRRERAALTVSA